MHDVILLKGTEEIKLTPYVSELTWSDSLEQLGSELDLKLVKGGLVTVGSIIVLRSEKDLLTKCVVTDVEQNGLNSWSIVAFDFAFYLNKNKTVKQFKKVSASECIKSICSDFNINVNVPDIPTVIDKIYYTDTASDIIRDILSAVKFETKKRYLFEVNDTTLDIYLYNEKEIIPTFKPAVNVNTYNVLNAIGIDFKKGCSIQELKNSVIAINENSSTGVVGKAQDDNSIKQFGLLQEAISITETDKNVINNRLKNTLDDLNKISETFSLQLIGSDLLKTGRVLTINNGKIKANGKYLITGCVHTIANGIHLTNVDLEKI